MTSTSDRGAAATDLGEALARLVAEPDAFAVAAEREIHALARPEDLAALRRVAPGIGPVAGVPFSLVERAGRTLAGATRDDSPTNVLLACERLYGLPLLEARWLAFHVLEDLVSRDPERTWQLLRRASKEAADWITVDALAHPFGRGILAERFRWAELGQLVFAPSRWERRLVGSTIATIPHVDRVAGRSPEIAAQALPLLASLIGDDAPEVQKALAWALRAMTLVDPAAVAAFCEREAWTAARTDDGHRAWVIRDALPKLPAETADALRRRLGGIRRRPGAPATSDASVVARSFVEAGGIPPLGGAHVERVPVGAR